jgi:hypothetical protein
VPSSSTLLLISARMGRTVTAQDLLEAAERAASATIEAVTGSQGQRGWHVTLDGCARCRSRQYASLHNLASCRSATHGATPIWCVRAIAC